MSATLSDGGLYRYRLYRGVSLLGSPRPILFIGVNPSTADAEQDDATIRKMIGFTAAWGYSSFLVGNVFAYRATDVRELATVPDPSGGTENINHLRAMIDECEFVVPCWGNESKVPRRLHAHFHIVRMMLRLYQKPVYTFGLTQSGDPKHPLMLPYTTELVRW